MGSGASQALRPYRGDPAPLLGMVCDVLGYKHASDTPSSYGGERPSEVREGEQYPPEKSTSRSPDPVHVTSSGKRDFADVTAFGVEVGR